MRSAAQSVHLLHMPCFLRYAMGIGIKRWGTCNFTCALFLSNFLKYVLLNLFIYLQEDHVPILSLFIIFNGYNTQVEISIEHFIAIVQLTFSNVNMVLLHFIEIQWSIALSKSSTTHYLMYSSMILWFFLFIPFTNWCNILLISKNGVLK